MKENMKKIVSISIVLVIAICMMGSVYASLSCNMSMQANKTEVSKNEEFIVNVNVSNIQSERGIIALEATLKYDKESLELVKMEGKNGWETPIKDITYNENNGKIAIDRSGLGKNAETVFSMTFKVKETSKKNLTVSLGDVKVADGTQLTRLGDIIQNITVAEGTQNPDPVPQPKPEEPEPTPSNPGTTTGNTSSNSTNNSTTVGDKTTSITKNTINKNVVTNKNLPKAGGNNNVLLAFMTLLVVATVIFFVKIRLINKEMGL